MLSVIYADGTGGMPALYSDSRRKGKMSEKNVKPKVKAEKSDTESSAGSRSPLPPHKEGGRGYSPNDERDFSGRGLELLRRAALDITFLIDRGYPLKSAVIFCANHYLLSERQRIALQRWCSPTERIASRLERELPAEDVAGAHLHVDGFNTVISLETGLCGSVLLSCPDDTVRDLAGLRGTYRLIPQTDEAVRLLGKRARDLSLAAVTFWLDWPVSNSGRLASRIRELWEDDMPRLSVEIVPDVDRQLERLPLVATSDAIILDHVAAWHNLTRPVLDTLGAKLTWLGVEK